MPQVLVQFLLVYTILPLAQRVPFSPSHEFVPRVPSSYKLRLILTPILAIRLIPGESVDAVFHREVFQV